MLCLFFYLKGTIGAVKSAAHVMPCFMCQHSAFLCGGLAFAAINDKEIVKERDCEIVFEFNIAEDAGVVNGCETGDGVVKFYSKEIPAADISTCIILFGKGGGGESDLTVATREQLGHVKIGNGIEVTEDGTISANAKVSEDQIATSDDTSEMLKEIYGE